MAFNWRNHDDKTIERHFNPRLTIPDFIDLIQALPKIAASARGSLGGSIDIRYGKRPKETLDVFPAMKRVMGDPPPALIFIHGGYWRMMDKSDHSHVALDMVQSGVTHISLNYDLCPEVTLDNIIDEIRNAIIFIYKHSAELGVDKDRLFLSGHSAGGHLTGMMLKENWILHGLPSDVFKGAIPLSPIFEPEAIIHTSINEDVRLSIEMAQRNNVLAAPPAIKVPIIVAVGELEPEGFRQQSISYVDLCQANGIEAEFYDIKGCNHFTALDAFSRKNHELFEKIISIISQ